MIIIRGNMIMPTDRDKFMLSIRSILSALNRTKVIMDLTKDFSSPTIENIPNSMQCMRNNY